MFSRRSMPRLSPTSAAGTSPSRPAGARYPNSISSAWSRRARSSSRMLFRSVRAQTRMSRWYTFSGPTTSPASTASSSSSNAAPRVGLSCGRTPRPASKSVRSARKLVSATNPYAYGRKPDGIGERRESDYWFELETMSQSLGGRRWWFMCQRHLTAGPVLGRRRIDVVTSHRMGVGVFARRPGGLGERVLPAEPVPVVDGEGKRENVGTVADRRHIGGGWQAIRTTLTLEQLYNGWMLRIRGVARLPQHRRDRQRGETNAELQPDRHRVV